MRCYRCGAEGHQAAECMSRMPEGHRRERQQGRRKIPCNRCEAFGHEAPGCHSTLRNQQTSRSGPTGGKPSRPLLRVGCDVRVRKELPQARLTEDDDLLEFKSGEKITVLNGTCMGAEMTEGMPVVTGKAGDRCVEVLRDTGCNGVKFRKDLVSQKELTENEGYMMTVDRTLKKAPMARIKADTPYFVGKWMFCVYGSQCLTWSSKIYEEPGTQMILTLIGELLQLLLQGRNLSKKEI